MTQWVAIAATAENQVLAWHDSLSLLESACGGEFRAISRIYGITEIEYAQLKQNNLDFRIKFSNARTTTLEGDQKNDEVTALSNILCLRVAMTVELHARIGHAYKRFSDVVSWQQEAYRFKAEEAKLVLEKNETNPALVGFVADYADLLDIPIDVAARLIIVKAENQKHLIRKLERLRTKHQETIRTLSSKLDAIQLRAEMDKDAFLSMLM
jgi:hypothetical protein